MHLPLLRLDQEIKEYQNTNKSHTVEKINLCLKKNPGPKN